MFKVSLEKYIERLMMVSFVMPLFLFPAIWTRTIFPFIVPKVVFFRSIVLLMLGCYIALLLVDYKKYRIQNTAVTLSVIGFLLSFTLSTFVGVDTYKSLWDNHERMLGLFTVLHYGIYYLVAAAIVKQWGSWKQLLKYFFIFGTLVIIFGAWQKFVNPEFLLNQKNVRVSATLGNPIYFAGYGLFLGYSGLLLFFQEQKKGWKRNAFLFFAVFDFFGILMSQTKGTLLGLLVSFALLIVLYYFHNRNNKKQRMIWTGLFGASLLGGIILFIFRTTDFVRGIPGIGQILNANFFSDTGGTRLMAWKIAYQGWLEHPIIGWGPNNYYYAFNKYYNPQFLTHGWGETWFDNAHNVLMNTLTVQGIVGVVLYFGLLIIPVSLLWKRYREGKLQVHFAFLSIGFLVAHFIHNLFVFEDPTSYLYFFFFLALVNFVTTKDVSFEEKIQVVKPVSISFAKGSGVALIILFLVFRTDIDVMKANMATFRALGAIYSGENTLEFYQTAMEIPTPHIDDVRMDIARTFFTVLPQYVKANRLTEAKTMLDVVLGDLKKNRMLHPMDIRVAMQEAQILQLSAQYFNNMEHLQQADALLTEALSYSPKRQQIQYSLGMISFQLGNIARAEQILTESINNLPSIQDGWWRLVFVYAASGDIQKAEQTLVEAEKKGVVIEPDRLGYVNKIIAEVKQSKAAAKK
jgi:O-antigen ligase